MNEIVPMCLYVTDRHHVNVYLHQDLVTLQAVPGAEDAYGYWHGPTLHIKDGVIREDCVGHIHLWIDQIGAGYFAHELQHFIQDWIEIGQVDIEDRELVPDLAGKMTSAFWKWFYENYSEAH